MRRAGELQYVQPLFQEVNEVLKQLPIEAMLVEVARGTVGCRHHCHPRIHEPRKKTRHAGGISHIVDHHFVEGEQARLICQIGYDRWTGLAVFSLPRLTQAVMHLYHQLMKVTAALAADLKDVEAQEIGRESGGE